MCDLHVKACKFNQSPQATRFIVGVQMQLLAFAFMCTRALLGMVRFSMFSTQEEKP